jgi:CubicO group peptidase (beta-lactamase class C family)
MLYLGSLFQLQHIGSRLIRHQLLAISLLTVTEGQGQMKNPQPAFSRELDSLRKELRIPGMAAAIMQGDSIIFQEGYGYADINNQVYVTPNTVFRIASITKTFTSTLVMEQVEKGKLDLLSPVSVYGLDFGNPAITVRNLLTHTSEEEPGTYYQYNGFRFGQLGTILEKLTGQPFYQLLMENIVAPLHMNSTAPGNQSPAYQTYTQEKKEMLPYFQSAISGLAKPYELNANGELVEIKYLDEFGAFGGLASTVKDLLKYSAAIDRNQFVNASTQRKIFTPNRTKNGTLTPYGLGWFVQNYKGLDYYWHYGQTTGESGLFVKVPARKLTLVALTNIVRLSQPFQLGDGDLFASPVGQLLYKYFICTDPQFIRVDYHQPIESIRKQLLKSARSPQKDFYNKELVAQATLSILGGDTIKAIQYYGLYAALNFNGIGPLPVGQEIAAIQKAEINQDLTRSFTLTKPTRIRVYGVGEDCSGDFSSWCEYGWIEDDKDKIIWTMQGHPARHAGGALKNQLVDTLISLEAGSYKLRYKSDTGHAYNNWDSPPPDHFFWGIILFKD